MKLLKNWWGKHKTTLKKDEGFTLMEMVMAIPLVALSGGFIISTLGNSMMRINDNTRAVNASDEISRITQDLKNQTSCYKLEQRMTAYNTTENTPVNNTERNDFTFENEFTQDGASVPGLKCEKNAANEITVKAVREKNDGTETIVFQTTTAVYISE